MARILPLPVTAFFTTQFCSCLHQDSGLLLSLLTLGWPCHLLWPIGDTTSVLWEQGSRGLAYFHTSSQKLGTTMSTSLSQPAGGWHDTEESHTRRSHLRRTILWLTRQLTGPAEVSLAWPRPEELPTDPQTWKLKNWGFKSLHFGGSLLWSKH